MARVKVLEGVAVYHCISRTVNGERLFDDAAKEVLRRQLWQVADFCGVEILTYALLSNHFHVLVRTVGGELPSDEELIRRYAVLYPRPTKYQSARLEVIKSQLATNGPEAVEWRQRQLAQMGDVSGFMKLLKQRFSIWFNRSHGRFGTLWAERFKSVLVESKSGALRTVAAYIDLNPVRAGLVDDPKNYRFCGYAEAVAGKEKAMRGLAFIFGPKDCLTRYRRLLFGSGAGKKDGKASLEEADFRQVIATHGVLPLSSVLRHRVRYFSDGVILGSAAFVQGFSAKIKRQNWIRKREPTPKPIPPVTDWGGLTTLRGARGVAPGDF